MQVVYITEDSHILGINNIGDIVSWHEDDVKLGPAYSAFGILKIGEVTVADFIGKLQSKIPIVKEVIKLPEAAPKDGWVFVDEAEVAKVYQDGNDWKRLDELPTYLAKLNIRDISKITDASGKAGKLSALEGALESTVKLSSKNKTVVDVYQGVK
jgi:hypothetical protein